MVSGYINIPSYGSTAWRLPVATVGALPSTGNTLGDVILVTGSSTLYEWNGSAWTALVSSIPNPLPVNQGGTGVQVSSGANSVMLRDGNQNVAINNINEAFATTATAAGTTTLTVSSPPLQQFTGTTTQTVVLPSATTEVTGCQFQIFNRSTGNITVKDGGLNVLQVMLPGSQCIFTCAATGTTAGLWDISYTIAGQTPVDNVSMIYNSSQQLQTAQIDKTQMEVFS